ncbi:MAG: hypothetical protein A2W99_02120 [Bacteroidetes bacterium GWF2_33_16]|nr:MAG: hypothetical protein A2X00_16035 [Bacteroidetes bacterium GWE2_32_14]OFY07062.1 MAG: hypothetical protein A2W99_02120 [Bacteroidetes bacterium GWF2_33_16]
MKKQEIKSLLEKYYKGETNSEEERILFEYFSGQDIDSEFLADKEYFEFINTEVRQFSAVEDLSDSIWENIEKHEIKSKYKEIKFNKINKVILAIAASIIITVVSVTIIKYEFLTNEKQTYFADTYDNPESAYLEAKKALLMVSEMLNKGTNHIENLDSFEKGTKNIGLISNFDKGLDELKPLKSIEIANKYIKNK